MVAKEDEERAHAWKLSIRGQPDNDKSDDFGSLLGPSGASTSRGPPGISILAMTGTQSLSLGGDSTTRPPVVPRITDGSRGYSRADPLPDPLGDDAPMTARLERIITGRHARDHWASGDLPDQAMSPPLDRSASRNATQKARGGDRTHRGQNRSVASNASTCGRAAEPQGLVVRTGGFQ